MARGLAAVTDHVIDTHFEPSCLEASYDVAINTCRALLSGLHHDAITGTCPADVAEVWLRVYGPTYVAGHVIGCHMTQ